jgi:hypothetical protein
MVQPYNYTLDIASPGESFLKGMQIGQAGRAAQARAAEQEREADKVRRLNAALAQLGPNATYEDYMVQVRANPDLADLLLGQQKTFSDARKNAMFGAGEQAFMLLRPDAQGNISPDAAIAKLEESALAFENSGEPDVAKQLRDSAQGIRTNPAAARNVLGTMLAFADPDKFKKINDAVGTKDDRTAFQQDFDFIKKTFGDAAAAEFAQFGRSGIVSIPLGDGRTYVGPPSMAPGASRWQPQPPMTSPGQPSTTGRELPEQVTPQGASAILGGASRTKKITQAEANVVRQSLGPQGQAKFNKWLTDNSIKIIVRTGTTPDGRRVVQFQDGTVEYGAD